MTCLGISLRSLAAADCPTSVDDGERHTGNALPACLCSHLLHFLLVLRRLEELKSLAGAWDNVSQAIYDKQKMAYSPGPSA